MSTDLAVPAAAAPAVVPRVEPAPAGPGPAADVLTVPEAAAFLKVSEEGLRADIAAGRVPGRVVAGEWRATKAGLLAWLSEPAPGVRPTDDGRELAEHIRRHGVPWSAESEREAEEFIAKLHAARKSDAAGR